HVHRWQEVRVKNSVGDGLGDHRLQKRKELIAATVTRVLNHRGRSHRHRLVGATRQHSSKDERDGQSLHRASPSWGSRTTPSWAQSGTVGRATYGSVFPSEG